MGQLSSCLVTNAAGAEGSALPCLFDRQDISAPPEDSIGSLSLEFERKYFNTVSLLKDCLFLSVAFCFQTLLLHVYTVPTQV